MIFGSGQVQPWNEVPVAQLNIETEVKPEKAGTENAAFEEETKQEVRL